MVREKKMFLKEVHFEGSVSTKIKFILIHNFPTIIITNQKQSKLMGLSRRKCPVFQKSKTKNFDHYMDYYWDMNIKFYVPDKKISRKCQIYRVNQNFCYKKIW